MFVATLIAAPGKLDPALSGQIANSLGFVQTDVLSDGEAVDLLINEIPEDFDRIWQDLQTHGIDLNIQPKAGRRKEILIADMDSTMIEQECIDELAAEAGVGDQVAAITQRAMNGEIDFAGALYDRVRLLKGLPETIVGKVLDERITYMPGGRELVATMAAHGAFCALVSGGFTAFADVIGKDLGFHEIRANQLLADGGYFTGEVGRPVLGRNEKRRALVEICEQLGLTPKKAIAVGDGANDLDMLTLAGTGVALHAKPVVAAEASFRLNFADLSGLLFLQGYRRSEFKSHLP